MVDLKTQISEAYCFNPHLISALHKVEESVVGFTLIS